MQAKRNKIAPIGIFTLLFISRIVVSMTSMQSVYTGSVGSDIVISLVGALALVIILSLPAVFCIKNKKNPFTVKWVSMLYGAYFILLAGLNVSRFSYFASTTLNPESSAWVYSFLAIICALYGAMLGIESLSRFSSAAFILLALGIITVLFCNYENIDEINLYPVISSETNNIVKNILVITTSTIEPALFLCLSKRVNGVAVKQFIFALLAVFTVITLLFYTAVAVMGDFAATQQFPLYSLFEQANVGGFERIDVIHISFWILGIFIKSTLLIYCASICFDRIKQKNSSIFCAMLAFGAAAAFSVLNQYAYTVNTVFAVLFFVFCALVPALMLIFGKRNYGDELVQNL